MTGFIAHQFSQLDLMNQICKVCKMYFASQVMLGKHDMQHKHQADQVLPMPLIRPVRIAARRQRELTTVIALRESLDIEREHEDLLDITEISVSTDIQHAPVMPVATFVEHLSSSWEKAGGVTD